MGLCVRLKICPTRHFDQSRLRPLASEDGRRDGRQPSFLHQIQLFIALNGALDLLFFRKHLVEQVAHIGFRGENDSNAMVVELVDHLHEPGQLVLLRHIELRHVSNDHRVEIRRDRLIIIRPAILFVTP